MLFPDRELPSLTPRELARHEWQLWCPGVGERGQQQLKAATVLISRCGGVGGAIAQQLAVAGVGRLILAHAGSLEPSDLNRQILMRDDGLGHPRVDLARQRLHELNPDIIVEVVPENISTQNAEALVRKADITGCACPRFEERFALNAECVRQGKPLVHAAMFDFDFQVAVFHPPVTGCLRCLTPDPPVWWRRQFPVFGAVSAVAGALAAVEIIKLLTGVGDSLAGRLVAGDLRRSHLHTLTLPRDPACPECGRQRTH